MVTATSRQLRDRAWAQAQQKVPESDGSRTGNPGITARSYGIHGTHGTSNGATGAFPSSDRELLNRGPAAGLDTEFDGLPWVAMGSVSQQIRQEASGKVGEGRRA